MINTLRKSLSAKLSLWVVLFVSILFVATFSLMFHFARQAVHEESMGKAEDLLDKFEIVVTKKLHEKEVVTRQTHWWIEKNLNDTVEIGNYIKQILAHEPTIIGIAAAFKPGFYPDRGDRDYMIYYHRRRGKVVRSELFAGEPYEHQQWYEEPMNNNEKMWSEPYEDYRTDDEPIITYSIPLVKNGEVVGVYGVDISLYWLSNAIQAQRPSPNMWGAAVTRAGAFIIHPDTSLLRPRAMFRIMEAYPDSEHSKVAYKMLNGASGIAIIDFYDIPNLVAFKPMADMQYELAVFCPEDEVMGHYNYMIPLMVMIVVLALGSIMAFCWLFIHRELHPVRKLERTVRGMKNGDYDVVIDSTSRLDEVGVLTNCFIGMRDSIIRHLDEIECNKQILAGQNEELMQSNEHVKEAKRVKTAFLQNMTDQMIPPVNEISRLVTEVRERHTEMSHEQIVEMANQVDASTHVVTELLAKILEVSTKKQEEDKA